MPGTPSKELYQQAGRSGERALQIVLWGGLILVLIAVGAAGIRSLFLGRGPSGRMATVPSPRLPVYGVVPDFSLVERSGRTVERVEFLGKIWVVDFIYTQCHDTCPLQSAEMARLQADLLTEPDVRLVSITIDPGQDTPQVLSRYADRFGAVPARWLFLTGEKEGIYRFAREGLHLPVIDPRNEVRGPGGGTRQSKRFQSQQTRPPLNLTQDDRSGGALLRGAVRWTVEPPPAMAGEEGARGRLLHTSRFVLVDRMARIRSYYDGTDIGSLWRLRRDLKALLREE